MSCTISEEQLWSWVDREAPELERHVAACEVCRARADGLRSMIGRVALNGHGQGPVLPSRIGPYQVTRLLGEGGQGLVFEGEQQTPYRRVALKVLKDSGGSRDSRFFAREVESLARLRHPAIASIYQAGRDDHGRPYFAMDFIDGLPLTEYVQEERASLHARLKLFSRICEPITYAHEQNIIHRDLKPSNILVDRDGNPHILDFGLSRMTDADATLTFTIEGLGKLQGTLPYLSPELTDGNADDFDPRTDVYSLGVVLYELVLGRLPFPVGRMAPHEALRIIREQAPPRPSQIDRAFRGDLETIILKALEKEPARRYGSVAAFREDVDRYLRGEPISARPPSATAQFRRIVRRHRLPVAVIGLSFLGMIGLGIFSTYHAVVATRERDAAIYAQQNEEAARAAAIRMAARSREVARRAERVRQFLETILFAADPRWTPGEMNVRQLMEAAERKLDEGWARDFDLEAELRTILAKTFDRFGLPLPAERNFRKALQLVRSDGAGADLTRIAWAQHNLAAFLSPEHDEEVEALFRGALDIRVRALASDHPDVLETMAALARHLRHNGNFEEAESFLEDILALQRSLYGDRSATVAESLIALGELQQARSHADEARAAFEEALAIREELYGPNHAKVALSLNELGEMHHALGAYDDAEAYYRDALAIFEQIPIQTPNVTLVLLNLGGVYEAQGRIDLAIPYYARSVEIATDAFPAWHYIPIYCHRRYGLALVEFGSYEPAAAQIEAWLAGLRKLLAPDDPAIDRAAAALHDVYLRMGEPERAAPYAGAAPPPASDRPRWAPIDNH